MPLVKTMAGAHRDVPKPLETQPGEAHIGGGPLRDLQAGEILVRRGLLAPIDLVRSVADRLEWGSTLGEVLIGKGLVRPFDFYRALAEAYGRDFVNLHTDRPDDSLVKAADRADYAELEVIPWRRDGERVVVATVEIGEKQCEWAEGRYGPDGYAFAITAPFDIFWELQHRFRDADSLAAQEALFAWKPEHSAKLTVTPGQRTGFLVAGFAYLTFLVAMPQTCLIAVVPTSSGLGNYSYQIG